MATNVFADTDDNDVWGGVFGEVWFGEVVDLPEKVIDRVITLIPRRTLFIISGRRMRLNAMTETTLLTDESLVYAISFDAVLEPDEVLTDIVTLEPLPTGLVVTEETINDVELAGKGLRGETVTIPIGKAITFRVEGDVDAVMGTYEINIVVDTNSGPGAGGNRRKACVEIELLVCK